MKKKTIIIFLMLITLTSCFNDLNDLIYEFTEFKEPICVIIGGSTNRPGRGWANARNNLDDAIDNASPGDEIWVAGDISLSGIFIINKSVSIYGGFIGNESKREQAKGRSNITISVVDAQLFDISSDTIVLDGFYFTNTNGGALNISGNCKALVSNSSFSNHTNSAILCDSNTSLNLFNCTFSSNVVPGSGGAIRCSGNNILNIYNCIFRDNITSGGFDGGAIYLTGSIINISNSIFQKNISSNNGGAIYAETSTINISENCIFKDNSALNITGGAIYSFSNVSLNISGNCVFDDNHAVSTGAIYVAGGTFSVSGNCSFSGNYSSTYRAGAIFLDSLNEAVFIKAVFNDNYNINTLVPGSGALDISGNANVVIDKCIFNSNRTVSQSRGGGALYLMDTLSVNITDSFFLNNAAINGRGGAIYKESSVSLVLDNNFFQGNTPDDVY